MRDPLKINLYSDHPSVALDISRVSEHLSVLGLECENRGNLLNTLNLSDNDLSKAAELLAGSLVDEISEELDKLSTPSAAQITSEYDRLSGRENLKGALYDGYWVQRIYHSTMARGGLDLEAKDELHIVFTGRLFGTFEDRRYHARVVLTGQPSLISTSGLVEAPAKPKEYYYVKGRLIQTGMDTSGLDEMYKGRFVQYDDPKTTSILCSYALQVVFYYITGRAFCDNKECCLFNSHWQEDVLRVQYDGKPCDECLGLLKG